MQTAINFIHITKKQQQSRLWPVSKFTWVSHLYPKSRNSLSNYIN